MWSAFGNRFYERREKARIEQRKKLNNDTVIDKTSANYKGALNFFRVLK